MRLEAGTRLGPYEITAPLAAGGMGEVYRARDTRLGREVAVKVLPAAAAADPDRLLRFEQEARAASALNHPNIVAVHDAGVHEGLPYVITELLQGETLHERLRGGRLAPLRAASLAAQIAKGLAAAHDKGIIHRDLKPENLFLTRDGVKILDFGLAKLEGPLNAEEQATGPLFAPGRARPTTTGGTILGTVGYLSPEQVRGGEIDARSDLFSLGVILYEMLAGHPPFRRDSAVEGLHATLKDDPPWLSQLDGGIPPALEQAVVRCLEKEPGRRFQSARDLAFHLESVSGSTSRESLPLPLAPPRTRSRGRALGPLLGGLVLAALLGAAFLAGRQQRAPTVPPFKQLTFRRGTIHAARFAPDGQTIVFGAGWEGNPVELFSTRVESPESRALEPRAANILSISSRGEMAILLLRGRAFARGTLARAALAGGPPRELAEDVEWADWAPDGERLAVVRGGPAGKRLEFPIGTLLYETPGWISHPRISPRGDLVAFLDHPAPGDNGGSVAVVDAARKVRTVSGDWPAVWGLAWPPSGREVWFTAAEREGAHGLHGVTLSGRRRLVARVPLRMTLHDVSRDGRRILVTDDRLRRSMVGQAPGAAVERDFSWHDYSNARDLSADGRALLFTEDGKAGGSSVYLRQTDGSPAVRLGEGKATALSPDGKRALVVQSGPVRVLALPTGAGEARELFRGKLDRGEWAVFFPDGRRLALAASEGGRRARLYVVEEGAAPRAISPEGVSALFGGLAVSPDGSVVAAVGPDGSTALFRTDGSGSLPMPGAQPGEVPVQWTSDGAALYVVQPAALPSPVVRIDRATGSRTPWRELMPPDPSGVLGINRLRMTPDGRAYVYTFSRILSDLYIAEGIE